MTEPFDPFADADEDGSDVLDDTNIIQHKNTPIHDDMDFERFQNLAVSKVGEGIETPNTSSSSRIASNQTIEAFEPFADFENGFLSTSMATDIQSDMFPLETSVTSFNNSFISQSPGRDRVNTSAISMDSTISPTKSSTTTTRFPPKTYKRSRISMNMTIHEEMSCTFDHATSSEMKDMTLEGKLIGNLDSHLVGQCVYLSISDPQNHIGTLTPYIDFVTENLNEADLQVPFVQQHQKERVLRLNIPDNIDKASLSSSPINILQYSPSQKLRPIPILVHSKVRVVGKHCRLEIKIRSNPMNKAPIQNSILVIAVPPDVSGETLKTSAKGMVWDSMKRIVIWSLQEIQSGETTQVQLIFELIHGGNRKVDDEYLPHFPLLLRCYCENDLLSGIRIQLCENSFSSDDGSILHDVDLSLSKSYRVLHRKI